MSTTGPATDLDQVVLPAIPPVHLLSGQVSALQVTDRLHRGTQIVGRFETTGLAGFKVAAQGRPLRVQMSLSADELSVSGWHLGETQPPPPPLPRFVQIRSQGRLRQCVLLRGRKAHAQVAFDLTAEEIPDDGLICVEALDITEGDGICDEVRQAVDGKIMPDGVAGLRIDKIVFEEPPAVDFDPDLLDGARAELSSLVSSGGLANLNRQGPRVMRSGFFVVNPVLRDTFGSSGRIILRLGSRADSGAGPTVVWRKVNSELRWLRHATRRMMGAAAPSVSRILSITGGAMDAPRQSVNGNTADLELDAPAQSPYLVVMAPRDGAVPTLELAISQP
ncbi:hypothetical protein HII36_40765 [Nonomuraea sp. NN258]|uniref:hypothetical protein n=1 Tax=Nonomuraea antri TaxID=2730852 RepID=UPI0015699AE9|nr:hypothetical protein [Nonomuraea antri]NRQ38119.1 hypothetical protein [Nonomuraea antri]